ncbi:MAG: glycosyltransferase [Acidimicrobiales bacterium]
MAELAGSRELAVRDEAVGAGRPPAHRRPHALIPGLLSRGGLAFVLATSAVNGTNFLFHLIVSRQLGPGQYGALGSLLSLITVLAVPLGAIQLAVTRAVAVRDGAAQPLGRLAVKATMVSIGATGVFWGFVPLLDRFLNLRSPVPLIVLGTWVPLAVVTAIVQGALMGELRFMPVAVATFLGGGVGRLVAGVGLVAAGAGVTGAVGATVIGQGVSAAMLLAVARRQVGSFGPGGVRTTFNDGVFTIVALAGYTLLTGMDTILARHFLHPTPAGQYAAAALAGHIAMFLPGAVCMVVYPRLAAQKGVGPGSRRAFAQSLAAVGLVGVAAAVVLAAFPHFATAALFGARYAQAGSVLGLLAFASAGFGVIGLLCYFHLARQAASAQASWLGVVAVAVLVVAFHGSLRSIALSMLAVSGLVLVVMLASAVGALFRATSEEAASTIAVTDLPEPELDLTLVVPFYNPGSRVVDHVGQVVSTLSALGATFEVLAVADGCTDGSEALLDGLDHVQVLRLPQNQGKGAALRLGLMTGRGEYLGFIDGDGDIPASLLSRFVDAIDQAPDLVVGSKRHPDSDVVYPALRRLYSWGYQQLNFVLFRLPVRDTQTGVKLVRREVVAAVLPRMLEKRFIFDLELIVVARRMGYRRVVELPVTILERFTSTISVRAVGNMLVDTAAVFYRLRILRYYGGTPSGQDPGRPGPGGHLRRRQGARRLVRCQNGRDRGNGE